MLAQYLILIVHPLLKLLISPLEVINLLLGLLKKLSCHVKLRHLGPKEVVDDFKLIDAGLQTIVGLDQPVVGLWRFETVVLRGA